MPQLVFYIYDHLGNTRVTYHVDLVCPGTKTYVLDYAAEYYPYGKILRDYTNGIKEKYQTTQHERDQETGLDYRGARFYDSDIARFLSVDPKAQDYLHLAPYVYVADNPLAFIDPNGKNIIPGINWEGSAYSEVWNTLMKNSKTYLEIMQNYQDDPKRDLILNNILLIGY